MPDLKSLIRQIPDFPKPGILFYDITTLMQDASGWRSVIDQVTAHYKSAPIDVVLGIEARGFFFAPTLAYALNTGFIPVRKPGKLPHKTAAMEYALEYGTDKLEIHADAVQPGQRVLIFDDVLATGGTAQAVAKLVEKIGGTVAGLGFVLELDFLKGRSKLDGYDVFSLLHY
ncbi:MAG: adenine phosphoribosyltransferase [Bryobacterales bacterium]|nr:adenine phosphoribosyltransferase [Bryobacterales bacterium]